MVHAFHRAGLEVILDVVFNHTGEANELGPTVSFRGIDNAIYYWLADDKRYYRDFTGTGQTVNASHPVVRDLILDALRYWVMEMHVDGFRFDLASVLGRDAQGRVLADAPLLERIAEDPILRDAKLIAEAWDAAGAYQVGCFSQRRWAEWNGHFRDDVRRFWRGDAGMIGHFASRICGSCRSVRGIRQGPGVQRQLRHVPRWVHVERSRELLAKTQRRQRRGQLGRRGRELQRELRRRRRQPRTPEIEAVRLRQIKNFLLTLAISRGVPMLLAGDEFRRTQRGNNNAYCQDNGTSWVDWSLAERHDGPRALCASGLRVSAGARRCCDSEAFYTDQDIQWFDPSGRTPGLARPQPETFGVFGPRSDDGQDLYLMFNADTVPKSFVLPPDAEPWHKAVDTAQRSPWDVCAAGEERVLDSQGDYTVESHSCTVLVACHSATPGPRRKV